MPKFACKCGNVLNLSGVWPESEWRLVPMARVGAIADRLESGGAPSGEEFYDLIDDVSTTVYRCSVCGRLHLEVGKNEFESYQKELVPQFCATKVARIAPGNVLRAGVVSVAFKKQAMLPDGCLDFGGRRPARGVRQEDEEILWILTMNADIEDKQRALNQFAE